MTVEEFIENLCQRPIPQNPMAQIRTLARELAEGAAAGMWLSKIYSYTWNKYHDEVREKYLKMRWDNKHPGFDLLEINGYVASSQNDEDDIYLTKAAFDLIKETEPSTIFISYKRSESSAFALLVLKYLKAEGLEPFLDMALVPGEDWHDGLKERIQSRDYFILLLGKTTLKSPHVIKEIEWALEKDLAIIPIWQPEFEFKQDEWPDLPAAIKHKLANTHRIQVQDENPLEYDKAMTELLNRFGITP
jgi:hypothetical protein